MNQNVYDKIIVTPTKILLDKQIEFGYFIQNNMVIFTIIYLICGIIAVKISWECNKNESKDRRTINAIAAFLFNAPYILFHFFQKYIMDWQCPT